MRALAAAEQTYSYLAPSALVSAGGRSELDARDLGRPAAHPHFFTGFLGEPRQTAQALLVVAEVARTRFYEPPGMIAARIAGRRPGGDEQRRPAAVRVVLGLRRRLRAARPASRALSRTAARTWGTTNVDFNPPMRAALAGVATRDAMLLHVGHDEVAVTDARRLRGRAQGAAAHALGQGLRRGAGGLRAHDAAATS